jgi:hypothetical protein
MAKRNAELRTEVAAAVIAQVKRIGPEFDRAALVARFMGRGADRATLFRWVAAELASGRPGRAVTRAIKAKAAARARRTPDPSKDAAAEAVSKLPARVTVEEVAGGGLVRVTDKLRAVMANVEAVAAYAKTPDGAVRNARLLLQAGEVLRRCLDTAVRLAQAVHSLDRIEEFSAAAMDEIEKESPECAERIVARLGQLVARYGG